MNQSSLYVFTGSYNQDILQGTGQIVHGKGAGISVFCLDPVSGTLTLEHTVDTPNPSYLEFDSRRHVLYAVNELKTYCGQPSSSVSSFRFEPDGSLHFCSIQATGGTDAAHLQLTPDGSMLAVANFCSGSVCAYPVDASGTIEPSSCFYQHHGSSIHPVRQASPHAHAVTYDPRCRFALVPDLGCDQIFLYQVDLPSHRLIPCPEQKIPCPPGSGPRHCIFHPNGKILYVIHELSSSISVYDYDTSAATVLKQTVSTLPHTNPASTCSALKIHPSGKWLYASNRGDDSLVIFDLEPDGGCLHNPRWQSTFGKTPRDFSITPDGTMLIAANQDSDSLAVFRINQHDGTLTLLHLHSDICSVTCVQIPAFTPSQHRSVFPAH